MAQFLIPGVGWQDSAGAGGQFLMPGETWLGDVSSSGPPPPPPAVSALPSAIRLALRADDEIVWTAPASRRFAPVFPATVFPAARWRGADFEDPAFRAPARRRFAPVFAVVTDEGGISILW